DYYPWQRELFVTDPYKITDGQAHVSDAPGWGVQVAPDWLAKSAYRCSTFEG
ncbi:MAG: mandelate racemase/muconate lactonizing enzyme family protein, partial [Lutimaribacter sp.]